MTRSFPADVAVTKLVAELGILPWAAAGELEPPGRARCSMCWMPSVAAGDGATSLAAAIDVIEAALDEEVDALLMPASGCSGLMNLHKAKGLEAPVVVLAYPAKVEVRP